MVNNSEQLLEMVSKNRNKTQFNFKIFTKLEWIDTEIDNFCDFSDFILSKIYAIKTAKEWKINKYMWTRFTACSMFASLF